MSTPTNPKELALLRKLLKNLPTCGTCDRVATLVGSFVSDDGESDEGESCDVAVVVYGCDEHPDSDNVDKEDLPYADVVRALATLAKG